MSSAPDTAASMNDECSSPALPPRFEQALLSIRNCPRPRGLSLEEVPAPKHVAPYAASLRAETTEQGTDGIALASGRIVILHDPQTQAAWNGDFRLVVEIRSRLDDEVGDDPLLGAAAWSWLVDCLDSSGAGYHSLVGTVTRVLSETFGGLEIRDTCAHAEIRASWSPHTPDLGPHMTAWYQLLHIAAGHEPHAATALSLAHDAEAVTRP